MGTSTSTSADEVAAWQVLRRDCTVPVTLTSDDAATLTPNDRQRATTDRD